MALAIMTGYADPSVPNPWTERGYPTLDKPFRARDLDLAIRQATQSRSQNVVRLPKLRREDERRGCTSNTSLGEDCKM